MMFITDLGSEAYQAIYDRLELDDMLMKNATINPMTPLTIRRRSESVVDNALDMRENIEKEIITWISLVYEQERGMKDVTKLDELFHHKLSKRGIITRAMKPYLAKTNQAA